MAPVAPMLSVVIPLYCEESHIFSSLHEIAKHLDPLDMTYEFVLVDDGSRDNTWGEILRFASENNNVQGVRFSRNFGKEAAIRAGLEQATGKAVIVMDGDLQHPPSLIPTMVRLWMDERFEIVDAVKASRGNEALWYKSCANLFSQIFSKITGFSFTGASDFKLLDRRAVDVLIGLGETRTFYRGLTEWIGFKHAKVPMDVQARVSGFSTWSISRLVRLALTAITSFSTVLLHVMTVGGLIFLVFALLMSVQTLFMWVRGRALEGFTTVILLNLFIGGFIMLGQGIIGEYLASIYWETKRRPRFIIRNMIAQERAYEAEATYAGRTDEPPVGMN